MQTFTGQEYLKIDIASSFGLDKEEWKDRIAWFDQHEDRLLDMLSQAETPALYFAGVQAWHDMKAGHPIGFMISLDATASGLQIMAALTGDRRAAEICNVVSTGGREDAYTSLYEHMITLIADQAKISRDDVKSAIMPAWYGSKKRPKDIFGEGTELFDAFIETMWTMTPGCWDLNETFPKLWDPTATVNEWVLPDNFHVRVKVMAPVLETVTFLNEPFEIVRQVNMPTREGRSLGANSIHSIDGMIVREMTRRCSYDPSWIKLVRDIINDEVESHFTTEAESQEAEKMVKTLWDHYQKSGFLSARILDYIDSRTIQFTSPEAIKELLDTLPARPFTVISVHDCFRCHPNYGNDLRAQYVRILYEIARSNMLAFLIGQIIGNPNTKIGKLDPRLADDVLDTEYALS